jgi:hypothetical protein
MEFGLQIGDRLQAILEEEVAKQVELQLQTLLEEEVATQVEAHLAVMKRQMAALWKKLDDLKPESQMDVEMNGQKGWPRQMARRSRPFKRGPPSTRRPHSPSPAKRRPL